LREDAMEDVIKSDGLSEALVGAYAEVQSTVASLIDPLVNEYDIFFVQDLEAPPRLTSSSCD
jgi:hypothetical protein